MKVRIMNNKNRCHWCTDDKFKTDIGFSIIDDASGQYVHSKLIKFCPFCGRDLNAPYLIADDLVDNIEMLKDDTCVICGKTSTKNTNRNICRKCELELDDNAVFTKRMK